MSGFPHSQLSAVRAGFAERGETVQEFCIANSLSYHAVMAVLHGRSQGKRGEGHKAAVLLGLKKTSGAVRRKQRQPEGANT